MNDDLTPEPVPVVPRPAPAADPDADAAPQSMFGPPSAGGMIRLARQAQGIDLASLAAMLKIPLRRLEALEMGRHEDLQGPTFERALAQAACRVLKIDPKPVLALLPQPERNTLERVTEGLNTPFRERQGGSGSLGDLGAALRPAVVVIVLLVVAALAMLFVPDGWWARVTHPLAADRASGAPSDPASAPAAGSTSATVVLPLATVPAAASSAATAAPAPAPESTAAPASAPVAAGVPVGVDEVLAHAQASPNIPLQVTTAADSWVEVLDAQGHSLLSRTVLAGESVGLDGALPMRVKIGNARATHIKLRGENVDLTPWTRDNVARLELK